jgi:type IV pilus assembly protein PilC
MKRFNYKAKEKKSGKLIKGTIQAENEQAAGHLLIEQGYVPESVTEEGAGLDELFNRVTTKDRITFTRQLATLIGAGLPLAASLRTVAEQTQSKKMKTIVEEILSNVEAGKTLYESFAKYPDTFNGVYLALIKAGETSGTLDLALQRLANQEEKDAAMLSKIRGALVYPGIILVVIIAVLAFMMIMVVPQVQGLYSDMNKELPDLTKILVAISNFFGQFWWLVALVVVGIIGACWYAVKRTPAGRKTMDSFKLHVPVFGGLFRKLYVSRFARTAEMMLSTGVPMLDSIQIAIDATSNVVVEEEYSKSLDVIKGGKPLSEALRDRNYMLPLVYQMASIGEESGKIDEMLGKAASVYETELDEQINNDKDEIINYIKERYSL